MSEHQEPHDDHRLPAAGEQIRSRAKAAIERSRELQVQCERLVLAANRIATEWRSLRRSTPMLLKDDVTGLARTLRENGETPERALILLKSTIEPALVELPDEREVILGDVVRWFVESYFAA